MEKESDGRMNLQIKTAQKIADTVPNSITANQISWLGISLTVASSILFALGNYLYSFAAVLLFHFSLLLNRVDGMVARKRDNVTSYGVWLNDVFDDLRYPLIIIGISIANLNMAILACIAIVLYLWQKIMTDVSTDRKHPFLLGRSFNLKPPNFPLEKQMGQVLRYSMALFALLDTMWVYIISFLLYSIIGCFETFNSFESKTRKTNRVIKGWKRYA